MVMELVKKEKKSSASRPKESRDQKKRTFKGTEAPFGSKKKKVQNDPEPTLGGKPKKRNGYDPKKEAMLEKAVLGDHDDILKNLKGDTDSETEFELKKELDDESDEDVIVKSFSATGDNVDSDDDSDDSGDIVDTSVELPKVQGKPAAWADEDDDISLQDALNKQHRKLPGGRPEKTYNELLHNKFAHVMGTPSWSKLDKVKKETNSDDSDDELLKHSNHLEQKTNKKNKPKSLPKNRIDLKNLVEINKKTHKEGSFINSVQFNEYFTIASVGGNSGVLSLFQVDGSENNKLHNFHLEHFPIYCARFLKEGTEIIIGSNSSKKSNIQKNYCYSFDLMKGDKPLRIPLPHGIMNMKNFEVSPNGKILAVVGKCGEIHLLNSRTKELIDSKLKMNKSCKSVAFSPDGTKIFGYGESAEIYVWDLRCMKYLNKAIDDGAINGNTIAISPNGQFIATGSKQGVVNVYKSQDVIEKSIPEPIKRVLNLTTAITKLKFNPSTEILAMASDQKSNAFKMLHLPSLQVFPNFPTFDTALFNPLDIDFSPQSGYMALSNNRGFAYLYRLKHYENY